MKKGDEEGRGEGGGSTSEDGRGVKVVEVGLSRGDRHDRPFRQRQGRELRM